MQEGQRHLGLQKGKIGGGDKRCKRGGNSWGCRRAKLRVGTKGARRAELPGAAVGAGQQVQEGQKCLWQQKGSRQVPISFTEVSSKSSEHDHGHWHSLQDNFLILYHLSKQHCPVDMVSEVAMLNSNCLKEWRYDRRRSTQPLPSIAIHDPHRSLRGPIRRWRNTCVLEDRASALVVVHMTRQHQVDLWQPHSSSHKCYTLRLASSCGVQQVRCSW